MGKLSLVDTQKIVALGGEISDLEKGCDSVVEACTLELNKVLEEISFSKDHLEKASLANKAGKMDNNICRIRDFFDFIVGLKIEEIEKIKSK